MDDVELQKIPGYPISYKVMRGEDWVGTVYKDWHDGARGAEVFDWVGATLLDGIAGDLTVGPFTTRTEALEALLTELDD